MKNIILILCISVSFQLSAQTNIELTEKEVAWINQHQTIELGVDGDWAPVDFMDEENQHQGILADTLALLSERLGIEFNIIPGPTFNDMLQKVRTGHLKVGATIVKTEERSHSLAFTEPYFVARKVITTRKDISGFHRIQDLYGKTVAIEKGYFTIKLLQENHPDIKLVMFDSTLNAMRAVSWGQADAYIGNQAVIQWQIQKEQLVNLTVTGDASFSGFGLSPQRFAIYRDSKWLPLRDILDKGLASITREERSTMQQRWLGGSLKQPTKRINLTTAERVWVKAHPVLRVGGFPDWPPFEFLGPDNQLQGFTIEYLKILSERTGLALEFNTDPTWAEELRLILKGEQDIIGSIAKTPDRETYIQFTDPYFTLAFAMITRKDDVIERLDGLDGKTLVMERDYSTTDWIKDNHPEIHVLLVDDTPAALEAVATGKAAAYIGNRAVATYLLGSEQLLNLKLADISSIPNSKIHFGVPKDSEWTPLVTILNKALASIKYEEQRAIHQKWLGTTIEKTRKIGLTAEERAWLKEHKIIRLGVDRAWPPIEFINDAGEYSGMASDYMGIVARILGIEMLPATDLSWSEVLEKAQLREIDVLPALNQTPEREKYLIFTKNYLDFPFVVFTHEDTSYVNGIEDFNGKRIAVEKGYVTHEYLTRDHPDIQLVLTETTRDAIDLVSNKKADAYVGSLAIGSYVISEYGYTNVKVAAPTPYNNELSIGVRSDWPLLQGILQKALDSIDIKEKNQIRQRWMAVRFDKRADYTLVWKIVSAAAFLLLLAPALDQTKSKT